MIKGTEHIIGGRPNSIKVHTRRNVARANAAVNTHAGLLQLGFKPSRVMPSPRQAALGRIEVYCVKSPPQLDASSGSRELRIQCGDVPYRRLGRRLKIAGSSETRSSAPKLPRANCRADKSTEHKDMQMIASLKDVCR